ncbi:hypothetical protein B2J93_2031 [Marssonina coronariae]|uniref:DUF7053 domain-containing protein n=1 Tax=Diplocarpon coronariae TaxID=2795749 RepID=A0A218ZGZ2_9HELO|nr:hypothetical protein B2J93_2031 [Marssonina coronariae]
MGLTQAVLTTTTEVRTRTTLPPRIERPDVLSLLHDDRAMLELNPSKLTYRLLPPTTSTAFYASVPDAHKPPLSSPGPIASLPVYHVTEHASAADAHESEAQSGHWKGAWVKRFVPDELTYQTSVQHTPDGMISITHAPMGVQSVTTWVVREGPDGCCVLDQTGKVWSNRALMGFIRGSLQPSYERLAADFVIALEKLVTAGKAGGVAGLQVGEETAAPAGGETTAGETAAAERRAGEGTAVAEMVS